MNYAKIFDADKSFGNTDRNSISLCMNFYDIRLIAWVRWHGIESMVAKMCLAKCRAELCKCGSMK